MAKWGWLWAWLVVAVLSVVALTTPGVRLPADPVGWRDIEVAADVRTTVSQTFVMPVEDFQAIEVFPVQTARHAAGDIRFELYDVTDGRVGLIRHAEVPVSELVRANVYRLQFDPIAQSDTQMYRLDILASPTRPSTGIAFRATKGMRYRWGTMFINERERWADLSFATFAPAGRSAWRRLLDASAADPGLRLAPIVIGGLILYWLLIGAVLHAWRVDKPSR